MIPAQLAVNSVTTHRADVETCIAAYADAGFRNVEFMLGQVKDYLAAGHPAADLRKLLDRLDLRCIGGFEAQFACFADADEMRANHALQRENASLIAELGGTDGPLDGHTDEDPVGRIAAVAAEVADTVSETGVSLCIEFNWSPIVKSFRTAAEVARRAKSDNVGVLFDPAHYHCTPSKFEQLTSADVPRIKHVHVDDMLDKPGELSNCNADRVLPGEGCLDLRALFGRIEEHGYDGCFSIELFDETIWEMHPRESAPMLYASLLRLCDSD